MSSLELLCDGKTKKYEDNPPLTEEETKLAVSVLSNSDMLKFQYERRFIDPPITMQNIALFSFIPSQGAKPDQKGIYGFAKIRGVFNTESEAANFAQDIIKRHDSYHKIFHTRVGYPFPITTTSDYSAKTDVVTVKEDFKDIIGKDVNEKRKKEQQEIKEIEEREKKLLEDVNTTTSPNDRYIELIVKKAQLIWTFMEMEKKKTEIINLVCKAKKEIQDLDEKDPSLKEMALDKYKKAREEVGLDTTNMKGNFMEYLLEDYVIPEVDQEYERLYGNS